MYVRKRQWRWHRAEPPRSTYLVRAAQALRDDADLATDAVARMMRLPRAQVRCALVRGRAA